MFYYIRQERTAFIVKSDVIDLTNVVNLNVKKLYSVLTLPQFSKRENKNIIIAKYDIDDKDSWPLKELEDDFYINISGSNEICKIKGLPEDHDIVTEEEFAEI